MSDAIPSTSAIQPTGIQSTAGGLSTDTSRLKSADNLKKAGADQNAFHFLLARS